jgi:hypothetical protein
MDENLVGYLLKALDPGEQLAVEARLRTHPEDRARLERLRQALEPLADDAEEPVPPPGLALAALARVAEHRCRPLPPAPAVPFQPEDGPSRRWFRRVDLLVAAMLLIVVGILCMPLVVKIRNQAQRQACENNLRLFWQSLQNYSDLNNGKFPQVQEQGAQSVAGAFVPVLNDAGLLGPDISITCPGSGRCPPTSIKVRDLEELFRRNRPEEFLAVARDLAGSYAYSLGYRDEMNFFHGLHRDSGDFLPIMADRGPSAATRNSTNHGGDGQNVLYIGGDVRWCTDRNAGVNRDDIYLNKRNELRAGMGCFDTVLGPGDAFPHDSSLLFLAPRPD